MHSHTSYNTDLRHPMLSTIDWSHGVEVFCSCHVHFSLVYHVFDSLGVIAINRAQLNAISRCFLCCFLAPLGPSWAEGPNILN